MIEGSREPPVNTTIETFFHSDTDTLTHVLSAGPGTEAAIIDAVLDYSPVTGRIGTDAVDEVIAYVKDSDLKVLYILDTHVHADHLTAAQYLKAQVGGKKATSSNVEIVQKEWAARYNVHFETVREAAAFDLLLSDGEELPLNGSPIRALETPGHTPSCMTYAFDGVAFVGDTFFMPDYGTARCDFPGGDAVQLYRSLQKIMALGDEIKLYMCHDYKPGGRELKWIATVAEQRAQNVQLTKVANEEEYKAFREEKDKGLASPRLLLPSLQVNIRGGALPTAEENGKRYLKIPLSGDLAS